MFKKLFHAGGGGGGAGGSAADRAARMLRAWEGARKHGPAFSADPTAAWEKLQVTQVHETVAKPLVDLTVPKPPNTLRFVCISDTHNTTDSLPPQSIPDGDVLLHAGDFTRVGKPEEVNHFCKFLQSLPHKHKVVIAGNHDLTLDEASYDETWHRFQHPRRYNTDDVRAKIKSVCTYLEDDMVEIEGISIYGSPWQPWFYDWAFNLARGEPCDQKWADIPQGVDVLMTHGPCVGHGDLCTNGERSGCVDLLYQVQTRIKPKYHVFGHIHEG